LKEDDHAKGREDVRGQWKEKEEKPREPSSRARQRNGGKNTGAEAKRGTYQDRGKNPLLFSKGVSKHRGRINKERRALKNKGRGG